MWVHEAAADPRSLNALCLVVIQWSLQGKKGATNHFIWVMHCTNTHTAIVTSTYAPNSYRHMKLCNVCVHSYLYHSILIRTEALGLSDGAEMVSHPDAY